jgi:hypothetical protein
VKELSWWTYLRSLISWRGAIPAIYGLAGLYDFICGQFVDGAPRLGEIMPWYAWPLGLLAILLGLTFEGGYRQYRTLYRRLAVSPYDSVVSELARESYRVGGERKSGCELFLELAPQFREPISEQGIKSYLYEEICEYNQTKAGTTPISGEAADAISRNQASKILNNWVTWGLLHPETIDPAPGATNNIRTSQHAFPYSVYRLSAYGKAVFQHLKKRQ